MHINYSLIIYIGIFSNNRNIYFVNKFMYNIFKNKKKNLLKFYVIFFITLKKKIIYYKILICQIHYLKILFLNKFFIY